jgi:hypothetical protein
VVAFVEADGQSSAAFGRVGECPYPAGEILLATADEVDAGLVE